MKDEIIEKIIEIMFFSNGIEYDKSQNHELITSCGIDSMEMLIGIAELEENYEIEIDFENEVIINGITVERLAELIMVLIQDDKSFLRKKDENNKYT